MTEANRLRVCWTRHEWSLVVKEIDRMNEEGMFPANASRAVKYLAAQRIALPKDRWRSSSSFYQPGFKQDADKYEATARDRTSLVEQAKAVKLAETKPPEPVAPPVPAEQASMQDAVLAHVMQVLPDMLRSVLREELQRLLSGGIHIDINSLAENSEKRRVDVIGLLPVQVNEVVASLTDEEKAKLALRFYDQNRAMSVPKYSPDVLVCTKFISHGHQDRVKAQGSKVHYINGAATSAVYKLRELLN